MHLRRRAGTRRHRSRQGCQVTDLDTLNLLLTRAEKAEAELEASRQLLILEGACQRQVEKKLAACIGAMRESLAASGYSPGNSRPAEKVLAATLALVER